MAAIRTIICLLAFVFVVKESKGQLVPLSLEQRVVNSDVVFEGKVLSKTAAWDEQRRHIYTTNLVSVYKVFKGALTTQTVEVVTIGGTVGNEREDVSYGLKLQEGAVGIFTCIPNNVKMARASTVPKLKVYSEIQGFIRYDLETGTAKDVFRSYKSITNDVYAPVQSLSHTKYKVLKKADFKIKPD